MLRNEKQVDIKQTILGRASHSSMVKIRDNASDTLLRSGHYENQRTRMKIVQSKHLSQNGNLHFEGTIRIKIPIAFSFFLLYPSASFLYIFPFLILYYLPLPTGSCTLVYALTDTSRDNFLSCGVIGTAGSSPGRMAPVCSWLSSSSSLSKSLYWNQKMVPPIAASTPMTP